MANNFRRPVSASLRNMLAEMDEDILQADESLIENETLEDDFADAEEEFTEVEPPVVEETTASKAITSRLDRVAAQLEAAGHTRLAFKLDTISDYIDKRSN